MTHDNNHILAKSYLKWVTHLTKEATKREPNLEGEGCFADTSMVNSHCRNSHGGLEFCI